MLLGRLHRGRGRRNNIILLYFFIAFFRVSVYTVLVSISTFTIFMTTWQNGNASAWKAVVCDLELQ